MKEVHYKMESDLLMFCMYLEKKRVGEIRDPRRREKVEMNLLDS